MVGQNHSEYHGGGICCIAIYFEILYNIDILYWDEIWARLQSPGGNTPQDTNCTATCPLSRKLFKLDEPDMQDTAGEAGTNS